MNILVIIISGLLLRACIAGYEEEEKKPPEWQLSGDGFVYQVGIWFSAIVLFCAVVNLFV